MWLIETKNNKQTTKLSGQNHLSKHPLIAMVLWFSKPKTNSDHDRDFQCPIMTKWTDYSTTTSILIAFDHKLIKSYSNSEIKEVAHNEIW